MDINQLEQQLGIRFNNHQIIVQAFTHSSYVNEHQQEPFSDNERLEFLGDAVLELSISEYLFKNEEEMTEGEMTKLRASIVRESSLADFAHELHFNDYLMLGKGEEQTGGRNRPSLLADVFESFLGALYLDQGFETVVSFFEKHIYPQIDTGAFSDGMDYKSQLQELTQQDQVNEIEYDIVDERGPSHDKEFIAEVKLNHQVIGKGIGRTKKEAEQRAAQHALKELK